MGLFNNMDFLKNLKDATEPLPQEEEEMVETDQVDERADFNCSRCLGEGLVYNDSLLKLEKCPVCLGTGKVS